MELLKEKKVDQDFIDYLNVKLKDGMTLRQIVESELDSSATKDDISKALERLKGKIKRSPYRIKDKIYQFKDNAQEPVEEVTPEPTPPVCMDKKNKAIEPVEVSDKKQEELVVKKYEESLKSNPLSFDVSVHEILNNVHFTFNSIKNSPNTKPLGVYLFPGVVKEFKAIENYFEYLPSYLLVNVAISTIGSRSEEVKKSDLISEFEEVVAHDKRLMKVKTNVKKKQSNIKISDHVAKTIYFLLNYDFPLLNQSELVNLCLYCFAKSFKKLNEIDV